MAFKLYALSILLGIIVFFIGMLVLTTDIGFKQTGNVDDFFSGFGNTNNFELVQNSRSMKCEQYNEIWATFNDGSQKQLASFDERDTVFIDSSIQNQLDITANNMVVSKVHVKLFLNCDGNAMDGSTVVSGAVKLRVRVDSDPDVFIIGQERPVSFFETRTINTVPLQDDVKKEVFDFTITAQDMENILGLNQRLQSESSFDNFKSEMKPQLTFQFNHPTVGLFSGSFDAEQYGTLIITQFAFKNFGNLDEQSDDTVTGDDADGDGIPDSSDSCPQLSETVNGYQDDDGCPDTLPDTDGDGITDDDDKCPLQPETINGVSDSDGCPDTVSDDSTDSGDFVTTDCVSLVFQETGNCITSTGYDGDYDDDGFADEHDDCLAEPETFNGYQDGDGCPDTDPNAGTGTDSDGDGISDSNDSCPDDAETFNGFNDSDGCPDESTDETDVTLGGDSLGDTQVIPFSGDPDDDPTAIIFIIVIFAGFVGSVVLIQKLRNK